MIDAKLIDAITALGNDTIGKVIAKPDGSSAVLVPNGWDLRDIPGLDRKLTHTKQVLRLDDEVSFVAYVGEHTTENTRMFVDLDAAKLTAVFDYHGVSENGSTAGAPGYLDHVAVFSMKKAQEWIRWTGIDGKSIPQVEFATFVEENILDIVEPSGADMLEVASNLQMKSKVAFKSGIRLADGSTSLVFEEDNESHVKGNMKVPTEFVIGIPVFFGGERYKVKCFLRHRIVEGRLVFSVVMNRREYVYQDAVKNVVDSVVNSTGLPAFYGEVGGLSRRGL